MTGPSSKLYNRKKLHTCSMAVFVAHSFAVLWTKKSIFSVQTKGHHLTREMGCIGPIMSLPWDSAPVRDVLFGFISSGPRVTLWLWLTFYGCIKDTGQQEQQKMGLLTNAVKHFKHCRWDKNPFCRRKLFGSLAIYLDVNISGHCLVTFYCLPKPDLRVKQL